MRLSDLVNRNQALADSLMQEINERRVLKQTEAEREAENRALAIRTNLPQDTIEELRNSLSPEEFQRAMLRYSSVTPDMADADLKEEQTEDYYAQA